MKGIYNLNRFSYLKNIRLLVLLSFVLSSFGVYAQQHTVADEEEFERLADYWRLAMRDTKHRLGISDNDFNTFQNFYQLKNDSLRLNFIRKLRKGTLTEKNIDPYMASIVSQEMVYYKQFQQIKKEYPNSVGEYVTNDYKQPQAACNPGCTNIDFSNGTLSGWNAYYAVNSSTSSKDKITGVTGGACGAVTGAANDPNTNLGGFGTDYQVEIMKPGKDPLAPAVQKVYPGGTSGFSVRLGDSTNPNYGVAELTQSFVVSPTNSNLTYAYAIFLENPSGHTYTEQPFFSVVLLDSKGDTISHCLVYNVVSSNAAANGFDSVFYNQEGDYVYYKNWVQVFADLQGYIGQCITLKFTCADCALGGHFGYAYISASCSSLNVINSSKVLCGNGIKLSAPPGANGYLWSGPTGGIVGPNNTQTILADSAGTYNVIIEPVTGQACSDTLTIVVPKNNKPPMRDSIIMRKNVNCFGQANGVLVAGAKGGTSPLTYTWSNGPTAVIDTGLAAGTYTLTVTDSNGCQVQLTDTIKQPAKLISSIATAQPMCPGQTAKLVGSASGGVKPYIYTWDGMFTGQSYSVSPTTSTTYTLQVTDSNGCNAPPVVIDVKINPKPTVKFTADTLDGCYPACINFTDHSTAAPDSLSKWSWNFGDGDTSNSRKTSHCYEKPGSYNIKLYVVSDSGCAADTTITKMITVFSHPNAVITATPQVTSILEPNVVYTNKTTDEYGIITWQWQVNNAGITTDTTQNIPTITYKDTGWQCTRLIAVNQHGCVDTANICVDIQPVYAFYVPSAFSPNADGHNDVFLPQGIGICGFDMYIFDRWGTPIFHTTDLYQGWNGVADHGSKTAQEDTYVYLINTVDCVHHQGHRYVGNVTLIK